jgi:hypothetical protein
MLYINKLCNKIYLYSLGIEILNQKNESSFDTKPLIIVQKS